MRKVMMILSAAVLVAAFCIESAQAIPAFARRYRLSCKTCHNPFPVLSAYGEEFAGNAFQLPDGDEPARSYADVGDEKLNLLRNFPVAARLDLPFRYEPDKEKADNDFRFVDRVKLLSGGAVAKDIAYYFYFYMNEHGEITGVEDAYIHFNNLFGAEFDILAGQFQISDPLFKRELRLTFQDYQIYKQRIGDSAVNLAYDRGLMLTYSPRGGTDFVLEILNGNGLGPRGEEGGFDDDSFKNLFGRVSQDLGGGFRIGGFYYLGRQTNDEITNQSDLWGIDASYGWKDVLTVNAQYLGRTDDDPFFASGPLPDVETNGGLVEVIYGPKGAESNFYFILLYNWIDSDLDIYDFETATVNTNYLLRRNIRMFGEYTRDLEREANVFTAGLVMAF